MELMLVHETPTHIRVLCDQHISHTFLRWNIRHPDEQVIFHDPIAYGRILYQELFPSDTAAWRTLMRHPERLVVVVEDTDLDSIPWEYLFGALSEEKQAPERFLVTEIPFVRALPTARRIAPPPVKRHLHIVTVPSSPLSETVARLDVEAEWGRLKAVAISQPFALTLETIQPPTITHLSQILAERQQVVLHFMGHGQQTEREAVLCFEQENGDLDSVGAQRLVECVRGSVFLATLNACVSAASGKTVFSNLASVLVHQRVPYALGMRFRISDDEATVFSYTFYEHVARGVSVEESLYQARRALYQRGQSMKDSPNLRSVGVPVLYTSLATPAAGFVHEEGKPIILESQPPIEISVLPRAEWGLQGRLADLKQLGTHLTGNNRPRILTIHGAGGQGKTILARQAVGRFAWAWPGGIWAISLEHLPDRAILLNGLARFLGINIQEPGSLDQIEQQILSHLTTRRILLVLDNAETLVDALTGQDEVAVEVAHLLQRLLSRSVHLLVASRVPLGWDNEVVLELGGLSPVEGAYLFRKYAPHRDHVIDQANARKLSELVGGHPLSLRLLGGAFDSSYLNLATFLAEAEGHLRQAEDNKQDQNHRHRSLDRCIEISLRSLDEEQRAFLHGLCIFHAPFLPLIAVVVFDPDADGETNQQSPVHTNLRCLWERGLLERREVLPSEENILLYALLPAMRLLIEQTQEEIHEHEDAMKRFGHAITVLLSMLFQDLDRHRYALVLAQQCEVDIERGRSYTPYLGQYLLSFAKIIHRLRGAPRSIPSLEQALEVFQADGDKTGEAATFHALANVYDSLGQRERALESYEQALSLWREIGERTGEANTLTNMTLLYDDVEQRAQALKTALSIWRETGNRAGEARAWSALAALYENLKQREQAQDAYVQALFISIEAKEPGEAIGPLYAIARISAQKGQKGTALELYKQALSLWRMVGDRLGEADTLNGIAHLYGSLGQPQKELELSVEALSIWREIGNREGEAETLHDIAYICREMGEHDKALDIFEQACSLWRAQGDRKGEARALNGIAQVYDEMGQRERALKLLEQAWSVWQASGNQTQEVIILSNMAGIYSEMGRNQRALALYEQSLHILEEIDDLNGEVVVLYNMGLVYEKMGQRKKAQRIFEPLLEIRKKLGDRGAEASTLNGLGLAHQERGNKKKAFLLYEEALPIRREVGDRAGEATTLYNMANTYREIGQRQRALKLYEEALSIWREVENPNGEVHTLNNMADTYDDIGQYQRAQELYEEALPIARKLGDPAMESTVLSNLGTLLYGRFKRRAEALTYIEQAIALLKAAGLSQDAARQKLKHIQYAHFVLKKLAQFADWVDNLEKKTR